MFDASFDLLTPSLSDRSVSVTAVTTVLSGDGTERKFTLRSNTSAEILQDFNEDSTFREIIASMSLERMKADAQNNMDMDSKLCVYCTQPSTDIFEVNKEAETSDGEITICLDTQLICRNKNCQFLVKAKTVPVDQQEFPLKLMMFIVQKSMRHCGWSPNGRVFSVSNRTLFSITTLPLHFPRLGYDDFIQELKGWGFQVSVFSQGVDFSHPSFQRDDPMLVFQMLRHTSVGATPTHAQALLASAQGAHSTQSMLPSNLPTGSTVQTGPTNMPIGSLNSLGGQLPSLERKEKVPSAAITQMGTEEKQMKPRMFFESLRAALDDETTNDIISWTGEGQTFAILNQDHLVAIVLPKYFSATCDLETFLSLLDSHDFTFTGHGVFSHPGFHREKFKKKKKKSIARRAETRKQPRFPDALFSALKDESIKHIISWTEDGRSIWVKDKELLVTEVYPKHFSWMIKMQDFYNGLCNYNFKAEARGAGKYSNPDFRRDSPGLVVKSKNSSAAKKRAAERARQQVQDMKEAYKKAGFDADKIPDVKEE